MDHGPNPIPAHKRRIAQGHIKSMFPSHNDVGHRPQQEPDRIGCGGRGRGVNEESHIDDERGSRLPFSNIN